MKQLDKLRDYAGAADKDKNEDPEDAIMAPRIPVALTRGQMRHVNSIMKSEGQSFAGYIRSLVVRDISERGLG